MKKKSIHNNYRQASLRRPLRRQRGDAIIEAMFGAVIMGIIIVGVTQSTSVMIQTQSQSIVQETQMASIRNAIVNNNADGNICSMDSINSTTGSTITFNAKSHCANDVKATVNFYIVGAVVFCIQSDGGGSGTVDAIH